MKQITQLIKVKDMEFNSPIWSRWQITLGKVLYFVLFLFDLFIYLIFAIRYIYHFIINNIYSFFFIQIIFILISLMPRLTPIEATNWIVNNSNANTRKVNIEQFVNIFVITLLLNIRTLSHFDITIIEQNKIWWAHCLALMGSMP